MSCAAVNTSSSYVLRTLSWNASLTEGYEDDSDDCDDLDGYLEDWGDVHVLHDLDDVYILDDLDAVDDVYD